MTKIKELRLLTKEELNSKLIELRKELMKQNAQVATGTTPKSPGQIKETKKTIAKILLLLSIKSSAPKKTEEKEEKQKASPKTK